MPIKDTNEISPGKFFPPEREAPRVRVMEKYFRYRSGKFTGLVPEISTPLRLTRNSFRFVSNFWRDSIMADTPMFLYQGAEHEAIVRMQPYLLAACREVIEDMVTYGYGVFLNRRPVLVESIDARFYYPIRPPYDFHEGDEAMIAYPYSDNVRGTLDKIYIQHFFGDYQSTIQHRGLKGFVIQNSVMSMPDIVAGRPVMAVFGDGILGQSMYQDIEKSVAEIHRRDHYISEALDRASDPILSIPEGSMLQQDNGQYYIPPDGMVIPIPEGGAAASYVTWDAQFSSQFEMIDRQWHALLADAGISPLLVSESGSNRTPITGEAVRRLAIATVNRTREIREDLSDALKETIRDNAYLQGYDLDIELIEVVWPLEFSSLDVDEEMNNDEELNADDSNAEDDSNG